MEDGTIERMSYLGVIDALPQISEIARTVDDRNSDPCIDFAHIPCMTRYENEELLQIPNSCDIQFDKR